MLKMNEEGARREFFARSGLQNNFPFWADGYNTGSTLVANDAKEYINYYLAKRAERGCSMSSLSPDRQSGVLLLSTGGSAIFICEIKSQFTLMLPSRPIVTPAEMVTAVRKAFMLTVSTASAVFKVSRPTIYQWESLSDIEQIRAHSDRDRMKELYRLAQAWVARGPLAGRWLEETLSSGMSVLDLLSTDRINQAAVLAAHDLLSTVKSKLRGAEHSRSLASVKAMQTAFETLAANEKNRRKGSP